MPLQLVTPPAGEPVSLAEAKQHLRVDGGDDDLLIGSLISWGIVSYYSKTEAIPQFGGEYIEGSVGQPLHINPVIWLAGSRDPARQMPGSGGGAHRVSGHEWHDSGDAGQ